MGHVFVAGHGRVQVEVFNANGHELGFQSGDDAVEDAFAGGEI